MREAASHEVTRDTGQSGRRFDKYVFPILLGLACVLFGVLLQKFMLAESPGLSYSISESDPIAVDTAHYYPIAIQIANSGDTPLEDVILSVSFEGSIVSAGARPRLSRRGMLLYFNPSAFTNRLDKTFDLAEGESHVVTIVARGAFVEEDFQLESKQVMGRLAQIRDTDDEGFGFFVAGFALFALLLTLIRKANTLIGELAKLKQKQAENQ